MQMINLGSQSVLFFLLLPGVLLATQADRPVGPVSGRSLLSPAVDVASRDLEFNFDRLYQVMIGDASLNNPLVRQRITDLSSASPTKIVFSNSKISVGEIEFLRSGDFAQEEFDFHDRRLPHLERYIGILSSELLLNAATREKDTKFLSQHFLFRNDSPGTPGPRRAKTYFLQYVILQSYISDDNWERMIDNARAAHEKGRDYLWDRASRITDGNAEDGISGGGGFAALAELMQGLPLYLEYQRSGNILITNFIVQIDPATLTYMVVTPEVAEMAKKLGDLINGSGADSLEASI